ncbi:MAG: hydrogenase maturation protease [Chromatiales bacterium]|nr:hydrogenase maturation protease [Gammaproteobacteria bacterium]MBW6476800.1 hydrogenase maturation protease [Chromatiales bacterium]
MNDCPSGKARLVGIGSPFGEDRLGWQAVEALQAAGWVAEHPKWQWQLTVLDRPGTSLLEQLQGMDLVILVDALQSSESGPRLLAIDELAAEVAPLSGHGLGLAESLLLGRQLGILPEALFIIGLPMGAALDSIVFGEYLNGLLSQYEDDDC